MAEVHDEAEVELLDRATDDVGNEMTEDESSWGL